MLRVSRQPNGQPEIFTSLQGEGPTMGAPSVFLRLATCNLACDWCDTKYTWDWSRHDYEQEVVALDAGDVEGRILESPCRSLVITGGEPLLQQGQLAPLLSNLAQRGFRFEVETNGTIAPIPELVRHVDQWNVSPKLSGSGNPSERRQQPQAMEAFARLAHAYFKFVVARPGDVDEALAVKDCYGLPGERVILMPQGRTNDEVQAAGRWLSRVCIEQGLRFSTRLHILLWGDERGR